MNLLIALFCFGVFHSTHLEIGSQPPIFKNSVGTNAPAKRRVIRKKAKFEPTLDFYVCSDEMAIDVSGVRSYIVQRKSKFDVHAPIDIEKNTIRFSNWNPKTKSDQTVRFPLSDLEHCLNRNSENPIEVIRRQYKKIQQSSTIN